MGDRRIGRVSIKSHQHSLKQKLRDNCFKRIQEDRKRLLWKMRLPTDPSLDQKEVMEATFRDIVSDELKKMDSSLNSTSTSQVDDILWEYDAHYMDHQTTESDCEDILIEMQRVFYEDLKAEQTRREHEACGITWEEEEDNYLAQAAFENMRLNDDQVCKSVVWCPICKRGELQENHKLIFCSCCNFQLNRGDEVNLEIVRVRLGEAHSEHLDRGCRLKPKFCMETRFNIRALYIRCQACSLFEIMWNHADCILKKANQIKAPDDVEGLDSLRWEDQQKIRKYTEGAAISNSKGAAVSNTTTVAVNECAIEVSQTSRATCRHCNQKIIKGEGGSAVRL